MGIDKKNMSRELIAQKHQQETKLGVLTREVVRNNVIRAIKTTLYSNFPKIISAFWTQEGEEKIFKMKNIADPSYAAGPLNRYVEELLLFQYPEAPQIVYDEIRALPRKRLQLLYGSWPQKMAIVLEWAATGQNFAWMVSHLLPYLLAKYMSLPQSNLDVRSDVQEIKEQTAQLAENTAENCARLKALNEEYESTLNGLRQEWEYEKAMTTAAKVRIDNNIQTQSQVKSLLARIAGLGKLCPAGRQAIGEMTQMAVTTALLGNPTFSEYLKLLPWQSISTAMSLRSAISIAFKLYNFHQDNYVLISTWAQKIADQIVTIREASEDRYHQMLQYFELEQSRYLTIAEVRLKIVQLRPSLLATDFVWFFCHMRDLLEEKVLEPESEKAQMLKEMFHPNYEVLQTHYESEAPDEGMRRNVVLDSVQPLTPLTSERSFLHRTFSPVMRAVGLLSAAPGARNVAKKSNILAKFPVLAAESSRKSSESFSQEKEANESAAIALLQKQREDQEALNRAREKLFREGQEVKARMFAAQEKEREERESAYDALNKSATSDAQYKLQKQLMKRKSLEDFSKGTKRKYTIDCHNLFPNTYGYLMGIYKFPTYALTLPRSSLDNEEFAMIDYAEEVGFANMVEIFNYPPRLKPKCLRIVKQYNIHSSAQELVKKFIVRVCGHETREQAVAEYAQSLPDLLKKMLDTLKTSAPFEHLAILQFVLAARCVLTIAAGEKYKLRKFLQSYYRETPEVYQHFEKRCRVIQVKILEALGGQNQSGRAQGPQFNAIEAWKAKNEKETLRLLQSYVEKKPRQGEASSESVGTSRTSVIPDTFSSSGSSVTSRIVDASATSGSVNRASRKRRVTFQSTKSGRGQKYESLP